MTELLPCPFCGLSDMLTIDFIAGDDWCVECERCHVTQHAVWPNKYSAIMKWNSRNNFDLGVLFGHLQRTKILTGDAYLGTDMNKECDAAYSEICKALKLLEGIK